jgi:hypothetical protein
MKKIIIFIIIIAIVAFLPLQVKASLLAQKLKGRILLQVEENGEAWYVSPDNNLRYYLGQPNDAFTLMKKLGLGIKHSELQVYLKSQFPQRLSGKILLDVENNGEAYYIYPPNLKGYNLGKPEQAMQVIKNLGLGITNSNLAQIDVHQISSPKNNTRAAETVEVSAVVDYYQTGSLKFDKDWQERINNLQFNDLKKLTDENNRLTLTEEDKYKVILPDAGARDYGLYRLYQLKICSQQISKILGQQPKIKDKITWQHIITGNQKLYYSNMNITQEHDKDSFNNLVYDDYAYWKKYNIDYDKCHFGHEEVHRFVDGTPIPRWANEGLAHYLEQMRFKVQPKTPLSPHLLACQPDSHLQLLLPDNKTYPYSDISGNFYALGLREGYSTAACFWDHVYKNYGDQGFKKIIQNLYTYDLSQRNNYNDIEDFIDGIVVTSIGHKIKTFTARLGF